MKEDNWKSKEARKRLNWVDTALRLALEVAKCRSEDPYVQVGACGIKYDKQIILGYNGAPSGVEVDWTDRDKRRPYMVHAESNVLDSASIGEIEILAVTLLPCQACLVRIKQHKIKKVYYLNEYEEGREDTFRMAELLDVELIKYSK
jgi:dCMP deaminase|tara:strand:+ start:49 stop:489 length:441 start_codon:yes stop_codon:yes gene_type:complete